MANYWSNSTSISMLFVICRCVPSDTVFAMYTNSWNYIKSNLMDVNETDFTINQVQQSGHE